MRRVTTLAGLGVTMRTAGSGLQLQHALARARWWRFAAPLRKRASSSALRSLATSPTATLVAVLLVLATLPGTTGAKDAPDATGATPGYPALRTSDTSVNGASDGRDGTPPVPSPAPAGGSPPGTPQSLAAPAQSRPAATVEPLFDVRAKIALDNPERIFNEVRKLLLERYYTDQLDESALYSAAIEGMLRHVSPPQSPDQARIWTAADYEAILRGLKGKRRSLGIRSRYNPADASVTVTAVVSGSPADGVLEVHDRIMRIDGDALTALDAKRIDALMSRADGPVRLTVVRDIRTFEVALEAREHSTQPLETGLLNATTGYVGLRRVTTGIAGRIAAQLRDWEPAGVGHIVLDVRNNRGGVFIEGLRVAELFIPAGGALVQTVREGEAPRRFVSSNNKPVAARVTLLVNDATASAAEALAVALVTNGRARMLGTKTYGKATMDGTFKLANGMRVRLIIGAMYTGAGHSWHARGLAPTVDVPGKSADVAQWLELPLAERLRQDPQLRAALQFEKQ